MKPGATTIPRASTTTRAASESSGVRETRTIRPPAIATSAAYAGPPEPSTTRPPRTR
jgi:hypothetical protein